MQNVHIGIFPNLLNANCSIRDGRGHPHKRCDRRKLSIVSSPLEIKSQPNYFMKCVKYTAYIIILASKLYEDDSKIVVKAEVVYKHTTCCKTPQLLYRCVRFQSAPALSAAACSPADLKQPMALSDSRQPPALHEVEHTLCGAYPKTKISPKN